MAASFKVKYALILRAVQWIALIPIIGMIAKFVHLLRMENAPIPSAVMAALIIASPLLLQPDIYSNSQLASHCMLLCHPLSHRPLDRQD